MPTPPTHAALDALDRNLIGLLRSDGRAPVAQLALTLGVSRGTVQNRLDRLTESGAILGFTLRVSDEVDRDGLKAMMSIEVSGKSTDDVVQALKGLPAVQTLHSTNGKWDLIAQIRVSSLNEFDSVLRDIRLIDGISNSETSLLLSTVIG